MTKDKLRRLQTFLDFWFSPWGAAKGVMWEAFSRDRPFDNYMAQCICQDILMNKDNYLDWSVFDVHSN